jgi:putative endonuclease
MQLPAAISAWWAERRKPKPLGYVGERAAEKYLKRKRYKIVARGLRTRGEEIDLVAVDGRTIVFVEVKTRRGSRFGHPSEAVDERKQKKITRGALVYLKRHQLLEYKSRFDVIAIVWPPEAKKPSIEHFIDAFPAIGADWMFA